MGSDCRRGPSRRSRRPYFNPRSPDGERPYFSPLTRLVTLFQSTLPGWGATFKPVGPKYGGYISIHAPRMGSDSLSLSTRSACSIFQSTLPGWGATSTLSSFVICTSDFNPRSPDGERPILEACLGQGKINFNPRSPDGERHCCWCSVLPRSHFNPRSPDGERPTRPTRCRRRWTFQSTLPGWGATVTSPSSSSTTVFQSTLPGWGATDAPSL